MKLITDTDEILQAEGIAVRQISVEGRAYIYGILQWRIKLFEIIQPIDVYCDNQDLVGRSPATNEPTSTREVTI